MEMREEHKPFETKIEDTLYKIGMFAAMNRISIKTLRFYEERGLLHPAYINEENGYRYYKLSQMADLHKITALKLAGFTLDEILLINAGANEENVIQKKKSEILNQIAELTKQVAILDGYLAKRDGGIKVPVLVKAVPEVTVAYMEAKIDSYDCIFDLMPSLGERMEKAGCECALPEYCFTNYLEAGYKESDILIEVCEAVTGFKKETEGLKFKTIPATNVVSAYHRGSYSNIYETYEEIIRYIEDKGYEISGKIRESYIDGIWNKESEEDWLTEIQIPIMKQRNNIIYSSGE